MNSKIHVLDSLLANQIAAGEVIERPASVVKELVENSFDAKAKNIIIEIEQGGLQLISVQDDGEGIACEDLALALERHATSKIHSSDDLMAINSLGFRGEALASIGAAARVELRSCAKLAEQGFCVLAQNAIVSAAKPCAQPIGTAIYVRDLFYNLPARRKFMRTPQTEYNHIEKTLARFALCHFEVAITLKHNQREMFRFASATSQQQQKQRLQKIIGRDFLENALFIEFQSAGMQLKGWLAEPQYNRAQADQQYFFINGRYVRDKVLAHALKEAYHDVMFHGRYPAFVLSLAIDPKLVDVNVHPTKHEVRFRESHHVHEFVKKGVKDALAQIRVGQGINVIAQQDPLPSAPVKPYPLTSNTQLMQPALRVAESPSANYTAAPMPTAVLERPALGVALAQVSATYILAETSEGLIIVDMHAAHERILYEKLKNQIDLQQLQRQILLVPLALTLSIAEMQQWQLQHQHLSQIGIITSQTSDNEIIVREIPVILQRANIKQLIHDSLADWVSDKQSDRATQRIYSVLATVACHAALRSPHALNIVEMNALLCDMENTPHGGLCNHGRPTYKKFTFSEMDNWFLRGK